jgi:hypothetical protein
LHAAWCARWVNQQDPRISAEPRHARTGDEDPTHTVHVWVPPNAVPNPPSLDKTSGCRDVVNLAVAGLG